ncbi:MAG: glycerate kinase [Clostridia bacterium]|nr:glycerate kinase [Clostridia bacterium]
MTSLRKDAEHIVRASIAAVLPDEAVRKALHGRDFGPGRLVLVAAGKAAWQMAKTAYDELGDKVDTGVVVTKYEHSKGAIGSFEIIEAGHPVPDENSVRGAEAAMDLVAGLTEDDTVLFLLSGGGSALFEKPLIPLKELEDLTQQLLNCGADITEINTIRKRLSAVKAGRFALCCAPAKVVTIVLSDIIGDPLDMIASGPAYPDTSTCEDAKRIVEKYGLTLSGEAKKCLDTETPKELSNVETLVTGSVRELTRAAAKAAEELGYEAHILTDTLDCEARDAGKALAELAKENQDTETSLALIAGGETVVHVKGTGKGGRNQEIALSAAPGLSGLRDTAVFSVGSDGTDGPTDAAGGYVDGDTLGETLSAEEAQAELDNNNAYIALKKTGGLITTGPTGTNVNDVSVLLIKR